MLDFLIDNARPFLLITVALGGGAAWLAGRAVAETWRPWWQGMGYMLLLGGAVRFMHYALAGGSLTSLPAYALDTAVAIGFAALGFRTMRQHQMAKQYGFLVATGARQGAGHSDS
jgi:hypothetical protein